MPMPVFRLGGPHSLKDKYKYQESILIYVDLLFENRVIAFIISVSRSWRLLTGLRSQNFNVEKEPRTLEEGRQL